MGIEDVIQISGTLQSVGGIVGELSGAGLISGVLSSEGTLSGMISIPTTIAENPYGGEYTINPLFSSQVLQTRNTHMEDDVTVNPIGVSYVTNPSGGNTAYIGGEFSYG